MLGLKLRDEFLGVHMPGTAISLRTSDEQGAAQRSPEQILSITYPTADVQNALKAIRAQRNGRPVVLIGERGRGKSHIMAVMHHAIESPEVVEDWLKGWGATLDSNELKNFEIVKGYFPISEPVHNHEYLLLWDLLFDRHPKGEYYRGQFESMQQPFPPRSLLEKMFKDCPTCLILDEFQTWYTGLPERDPRTGLLLRNYAFNFVQNLSEISKDMPEILIFVISVLNNQNDAFRQVHRQGPTIIDFHGPSAKQDRQKLLLHRLFENRRNILESEITSVTISYASERFRLLHSNKSEAEKDRLQKEVFDCWPFSPELINLLEDHILLSQVAQETRDMIRILAQVFRTRGDSVSLITPADFFVDGESDEVQTLVDSIAVGAGQEKLRQIAQRNLEAVKNSSVSVPNAREMISSIWMHSMSPGRTVGVTSTELQLDITRDNTIDDNAFQAELAILIENSVNIHGDEVPGGPLRFGINENPRSKVRAFAKNDKLWDIGAVSTAGQVLYPGKDIEHIRKTLKHIFVQETTQPPSRVIILGPKWKDDPWSDADEADKPQKWDRPVLLVIPDQIEGGQQGINVCLGSWLAKNIQKRRNTVRFLLPTSDVKGLYADEELMCAARCSFLCSREGWSGVSDTTYKVLHPDFDRQLRQSLKTRFSRFAILRKWDFQQPQNCVFEGEKITELGDKTPASVEEKILSDLFDLNEFKNFVLARAKDSDSVGSLMDDLIEPPPSNVGEALPFLGETKIYEFVLNIVSEGDLVLNVNGTWIGRRPEDATSEDARRYIQSKAFRTGQEMRQIVLSLPSSVGGGTVTVPKEPTGGSQPKIDSTITPSTLPQPGTGETETGKPVSIIDGVKPEDKGTVIEGSGTYTPPIQEPEIRTRKSDEPETGLNLSGYFEKWGVSTNLEIDNVKIEFSGISVQQIKQILGRIPSTFKATLDITYKEGNKQ